MNVTNLSNPRLFVLRRKKHFYERKKLLYEKSEHKCQNIKNVITGDIECCIVEVATNDCKYIIAEVGGRSLESARKEPQTFRLLKQLN